MLGFTPGDLVTHGGPHDRRNGLIQDVQVTGSSAGTAVTYVVLLDGVREPVSVTDPAQLAPR